MSTRRMVVVRTEGGAGINRDIRKTEDKVVDAVVVTELAKPLTAYCRFLFLLPLALKTYFIDGYCDLYVYFVFIISNTLLIYSYTYYFEHLYRIRLICKKHTPVTRTNYLIIYAIN